MFAISTIFVTLIIGLLVRVYFVYHETINRKKPIKTVGSIKLLIFLGSGGHTGEMMKYVSRLNFKRYFPRYYVTAATDLMSFKKVEEVEGFTNKEPSMYHIYRIPRSREVGQSWFSTIGSTLYAFIYSLYLVFKLKPDLILCNGPGSCVPICLASFLYKVLGIANTYIIFIESICRVKSLSLSGKILYYFCEDIFVQWNDLIIMYPRAKYLGRLT